MLNNILSCDGGTAEIKTAILHNKNKGFSRNLVIRLKLDQNNFFKRLLCGLKETYQQVKNHINQKLEKVVNR